MKHNRIRVIALAAMLLCMAVASAQAQKKIKIKGMITSRTGDAVTLKTADGKVTVTLDDFTKGSNPRALGFARSRCRPPFSYQGLECR